MKNPYAFRQEYAWALIAVASCAFVAAFLSLQAGFFALLFAIIAYYAWKYPEEGFLLLLLVMPILPMLKITQTIGTFSLVKDVLIFMLFFTQVALPFFRKKLPYRRNAFFAPILAVSVWALVAATYADSRILGILRLRDIGLYIMAYFAVLYLPRHDMKTMLRRAYVFLTAAGVTIALAAWQWFFAQESAVLRFDPAANVWIPRISSILAHPSIYGEYLILVGTLLLAFILAIRNKAYRVYASVGLLTVIPTLFLTYSRGVWLGFAASVGMCALVLAWRALRANVSKKKVATYGLGALVGGIVLVGILAATTPAGGLLRSIVDPTYGSNEERVTFFVRLIAPLTPIQTIVGSGLGDVLVQNFREVNVDAFDIASGASRTVQLAKNRTLVDNQHLKTFIEMGVIGLGLYLWLYGRIALAAFRASLTSSAATRIIGMTTLGFLAAFVLQGFLIDIWDIFPTNLLFWILAALLSQSLLGIKEKEGEV